MKVDSLVDMLEKYNISFFTGVPDSLLSSLCDYLSLAYGINPQNHVVAHNEGGAVALASGYYLVTGKIPCVYMQNSGIGNAFNPVISLIHPKVYGIPMLFIIGWRGEPGVKDEPQHVFQGEVTLTLLEEVGIESFVVDKDTTEKQIDETLERFSLLFNQGKSAAFVIKKEALAGENHKYLNNYTFNRELAIDIIAKSADKDLVVSTTGKISRELFEMREKKSQDHGHDFLTVGSMGHSAMIALGIALQKPEKRIWCLDGDGALLMHMGALAIIGGNAPENYVHVVLNNSAHESVGGIPTVAGNIDLPAIAKACGYSHAYSVGSEQELIKTLSIVNEQRGLIFIEVKVALGSRSDLGRPTTTPQHNKQDFMEIMRGNNI